jgi:protein SCO1/2
VNRSTSRRFLHKLSVVSAKSLVALTVALLLGCGTPPPARQFISTDVTGAEFARDFSLIDHEGTRRTLSDFRGQVAVVFFGFTHCPDICPTTLGELALALKKMGPEAEKVEVLFITVDPERDTPEVLARYLSAFGPDFVGLTGSPEEMAAIAKEFKVVQRKQGGGENYIMEHSAGTYVFDPQGKLRLYASPGQKADAFAHDIKILLGQS